MISSLIAANYYSVYSLSKDDLYTEYLPNQNTDQILDEFELGEELVIRCSSDEGNYITYRFRQGLNLRLKLESIGKSTKYFKTYSYSSPKKRIYIVSGYNPYDFDIEMTIDGTSTKLPIVDKGHFFVKTKLDPQITTSIEKLHFRSLSNPLLSEEEISKRIINH